MSELVYNAKTNILTERETVVENSPFTVLAQLRNQGINAEDCDLDCVDNVWELNYDRYHNRLELEQKKMKHESNKRFLNKISEDIVQALAGVEIENIKEKMNLFCNALNEVRVYEGKNEKPFKVNE